MRKESEEFWKDIPRWEGYYQASTLGRVRTIQPKLGGGFIVLRTSGLIRNNVNLSRIGGVSCISARTVFVSTFLGDTNFIYSLIDKTLGYRLSNIKKGAPRKSKPITTFTDPKLKSLPNEEWADLKKLGWGITTLYQTYILSMLSTLSVLRIC